MRGVLQWTHEGRQCEEWDRLVLRRWKKGCPFSGQGDRPGEASCLGAQVWVFSKVILHLVKCRNSLLLWVTAVVLLRTLSPKVPDWLSEIAVWDSISQDGVAALVWKWRPPWRKVVSRPGAEPCGWGPASSTPPLLCLSLLSTKQGPVSPPWSRPGANPLLTPSLSPSPERSQPFLCGAVLPRVCKPNSDWHSPVSGRLWLKGPLWGQCGPPGSPVYGSVVCLWICSLWSDAHLFLKPLFVPVFFPRMKAYGSGR